MLSAPARGPSATACSVASAALFGASVLLCLGFRADGYSSPSELLHTADGLPRSEKKKQYRQAEADAPGITKRIQNLLIRTGID